MLLFAVEALAQAFVEQLQDTDLLFDLADAGIDFLELVSHKILCLHQQFCLFLFDDLDELPKVLLNLCLGLSHDLTELSLFLGEAALLVEEEVIVRLELEAQVFDMRRQ